MPFSRTRFATTGALVCALALAGCGSGEVSPVSPDPRLAQSRQAVAAFSADLKQRLMQAMESEGATAAVSVCAAEAPAISRRLSEQTGATVSRTALRYRNRENAPLPWQETVMQDFAARLEAGQDGTQIEYFAATADGSARFMKPIGTAPLCLACHGELQPGPLADAIASHYPADAATGFSAGELRGAFVVEWPAR